MSSSQWFKEESIQREWNKDADLGNEELQKLL